MAQLLLNVWPVSAATEEGSISCKKTGGAYAAEAHCFMQACQLCPLSTTVLLLSVNVCGGIGL